MDKILKCSTTMHVTIGSRYPRRNVARRLADGRTDAIGLGITHAPVIDDRAFRVLVLPPPPSTQPNWLYVEQAPLTQYPGGFEWGHLADLDPREHVVMRGAATDYVGMSANHCGYNLPDKFGADNI